VVQKYRFEWDPLKAARNERKHGVAFDDAVQAFHDPLRLTEIEGDDHGEIRWRTIGQVSGWTIVVVSHTTREEGEVDVVRIISARIATPRERRAYEEA
jgi:uncharacterized DUF497 family protein